MFARIRRHLTTIGPRPAQQKALRADKAPTEKRGKTELRTAAEYRNCFPSISSFAFCNGLQWIFVYIAKI